VLFYVLVGAKCADFSMISTFGNSLMEPCEQQGLIDKCGVRILSHYQT
jgi:hypothetical protein